MSKIKLTIPVLYCKASLQLKGVKKSLLSEVSCGIFQKSYDLLFKVPVDFLTVESIAWENEQVGKLIELNITVRVSPWHKAGICRQ